MSASNIPSEHAEQVTFVNWFRLQYPKVLIFAIPNGGIRHAATARKLKAEGVEPGVPDLFIPRWRLWVEMKRTKGGRLSPEQKDMITYLSGCNYGVIVGHGWESARDQVQEFVKNNLLL